MAFIEVTDLVHIYGAGTKFAKSAVDGVSFNVEKGEFLGIIGRTGSGKSTLIQHLNGLIKPTSGSIKIDGADVTDKTKLKEIRRKIGLVFQYPEHQLFEQTVLKDVMFGASSMGLDRIEAENGAKEAILSVGLTEDFFEKSPFDLSGGQKRRAAIAGVLAMRPDCLILDEPAAGLDPKGRDEILGQIYDTWKQLGITVILVSHSMEDVGRLCERVLAINGGKVVADAPPAEIFAEPRELEKIGLAAPAATYIAQKLVESGFCEKPEKTVYTPDMAVYMILEEIKRRSGVES